ncbi:hypothetical protein ACIHAA_06955 [Streptomyces sp. NPDC052040]|uniref:hypothetical protein n=1 Tax=unclassified Streptomyces TaxID=2593676 RepID=UPI0037D5FA57
MARTSPQGAAPDAVEEFRAHAQEVMRSADASCGVEELEPELEAALGVLLGNLHLRAQFEREIVSLLDRIDEGVIELVSYTMHEVRWEPVRQDIERRLMSPTADVSARRHYEAMLDAFSDNWRDRDLYGRFSQ